MYYECLMKIIFHILYQYRFFEFNASSNYFQGDECKKIEISYSGYHGDLDDNAKEYFGNYYYLGITTKNDAPIYSHDYTEHRPDGYSKNRSAYLVKDWGIWGKHWKVVVILFMSIHE